jgi:hypothetical protein
MGLKEGPLGTADLFDLNARIGHCTDRKQLEFIARYIRARIKELNRQDRKKRLSKKSTKTLLAAGGRQKDLE